MHLLKIKNIKTTLFIAAVALGLFFPGTSRAQLSYYFPGVATSEFDAAIPTPAQFLGYEIGTHYTRHDRIVAYLEELAQVSDKASFQIIGQTYEKRPQVVLTVTSPQNQKNLEQIRRDHLTLTEPDAPLLSAETGKTVVSLLYGVHGNETSSAEAALLTAYYLVANQSAETQKFLNESVIHIDPSENPDGRDRAAGWHNSYESFPLVSDPQDATHNEAWPRGRTNHFWHDLNRDWLALTQVESRNRMSFYQEWYPNIQIDFHEMGTNGTYYLEPSMPVRTWNPIIPEEQYTVMNPLLAKYQIEALDELGSLYWTKDVFDNISSIYGSTYPDIQGAVGVTFEVGSSRGLLQESDAGLVSFRSTIRKHLQTGLATIRAGVAEKEVFFDYQKRFFKSALDQAKKQSVRAFVFGDADDVNLTHKFLDLLLQHKLSVYAVNSDITQNEKTFKAGSSYLVPADQKGYRLIHDLFESNSSYPDSVFYDITAWSIAQGYGVQYDKIENSGFSKSQGEQVTSVPASTGTVYGGTSGYAYLLNWSDYNVYPALSDLLNKGLTVRTAYRPFTANTTEGAVQFGYGTAVIAVNEQSLTPDELYKYLREAAAAHNVNFYGVSTGLNAAGIDLGNGKVKVTRKPEVALVVDGGVSSGEAGETWHLLSEHAGIQLTKLREPQIASANLQRYTTLILVNGNYRNWSEAVVSNIKNWVRAGGTLITSESAAEWALKNGFVNEDLTAGVLPDAEKAKERYNYEEQEDRWRAATIPGAIFKADVDISNPLAFGLKDREQLFIKKNTLFLSPTTDPYGTVAQYHEQPFVAGFVNQENLQKVAGKATIVTAKLGAGNVVLFAENPTFRSYWHRTGRLLLNAIFFGPSVR